MHVARLPYDVVMEWTVRELRYLVAAAEEGSFTDAAIRLGVSQAAVSRTIAHLESLVGEKLLRRSRGGCEPTAAGHQILPKARKMLTEAERFTEFLTTRHTVLRLGYAWAAMGAHTASLQRQWIAARDEPQLSLVRDNSPTAGLLEGACDVAIMRRAPEERRFESVVVGLERRCVAYAADDPHWVRRRRLTMAEIAQRTVIIDLRSGTTTPELWQQTGVTPEFIESNDVDVWLNAIAAGQGVGTTSEATAYHHSRAGITYRPVSDGPRIPVHLVWWRDHPPRGLNDLINAVTGFYAGSDLTGS